MARRTLQAGQLVQEGVGHVSSMKKGQSTDSAGKVDVALQLHEEFQSLSLKNGKPLKIILIRILLLSPQILFV